MKNGHMKLILFDCDGTLVDSHHNITQAMRRAFADIGVPYPGDAATRGIIGLSLPAAMAALAPAGTTPETLRHLEEAYRQHFFQLRHEPDFHEPLFPGARAALEALAARDDVLLGIATGKSRRGLEVLLERENLRDYFVTTQTADDAPSKPHPGMVLRALEETGMEPRQAALIGDTRYDMEMARAAGTLPIGVAWGYHPPHLLKAAGAAEIAEDFRYLPEMVRNLIPVVEKSIQVAASGEK